MGKHDDGGEERGAQGGAPIHDPSLPRGAHREPPQDHREGVDGHDGRVTPPHSVEGARVAAETQAKQQVEVGGVRGHAGEHRRAVARPGSSRDRRAC